MDPIVKSTVPMLLARRGESGLPLLAPESPMLVAGDSLAALAEFASHPLNWAAMKGNLAIGYAYSLHNIAVGTTSVDTAASLITVGAEQVRRGLVHPERITRDAGKVTATGAKAMLLDVGTNTVFNGGSMAALIALIDQYVAAMRSAGIERFILGNLMPRKQVGSSTIYMPVATADHGYAFRAAMVDYAALHADIWLYDGFETEIDPAFATQFGPRGGVNNDEPGAVASDGTHWGVAHAHRRETPCLTALQAIFPPRAERPYSTSDVYNWASNRYGNALGTRAGFTGTGGVVNPGTNGPTGQVATGWQASSSVALPAGVTVVCEKVSVLYQGAMRDAQKVTFSGTPAAAFLLQMRAFAGVPCGTDADTKLRLNGTEKVQIELVVDCAALTGLSNIQWQSGSGLVSLGGSSIGASSFYGPIDSRYVMRRQTPVPITNAATSIIPMLQLNFRAGVPATGSFTMIHAFVGHEA